MEYGPILIVFGLFLVGRGVLDRWRSDAIARNNRSERDKVRDGQLWRRARWSNPDSPPPVHSLTVRRQGLRVIAFGAALVAAGILVTVLA